jgi:hypothetical protein
VGACCVEIALLRFLMFLGDCKLLSMFHPLGLLNVFQLICTMVHMQFYLCRIVLLIGILESFRLFVRFFDDETIF